MNGLMCELLKVAEHKRKNDGSKYYSVTVLIEYKVTVLFFNDTDLYEKLSKLERQTAIQLYGDLRIRDEYSFTFTPKDFEM